mgnify:CR=1 FL=1
MKVGFVSLGCPKNQIDTEVIDMVHAFVPKHLLNLAEYLKNCEIS